MQGWYTFALLCSVLPRSALGRKRKGSGGTATQSVARTHQIPNSRRKAKSFGAGWRARARRSRRHVALGRTTLKQSSITTYKRLQEPPVSRHRRLHCKERSARRDQLLDPPPHKASDGQERTRTSSPSRARFVILRRGYDRVNETSRTIR